MPQQREGLWQLFVKGIEGKTATYDVHQDASVDEFMRIVEKRTGIPPEEQILIHGGKQLESGKSLKDYKAIGNKATLFMVLRLLGGSSDSSDSSDSSLTEIPGKVLDDGVELTDEPDMITWDDDEGGQRAKMPCGHAIGPESLTAYCRSLLDAGRYRFLCPYMSSSGEYCGKEWSYIEVRRLGVLTDEEQEHFETKISENFVNKAMGIQQCPKCQTFCTRASSKNVRVVCGYCSRKPGASSFHFCWHCLHEWRNDGVTNCGNSECTGEDHRIRILRNAPEKQVVGVTCPSRRACPHCGMLIEHITKCKQMKCPCGTEFCFICLKKREKGKWQCGIYNTKCTPASRQKEIPGG